jgi:hypothetical protein
MVMQNSERAWDEHYDLQFQRRVSQDAVASMDIWRQTLLDRAAAAPGTLSPTNLVIPDPSGGPDGPSAKRARVSEVEVCGITSPSDMVMSSPTASPDSPSAKRAKVSEVGECGDDEEDIVVDLD